MVKQNTYRFFIVLLCLACLILAVFSLNGSFNSSHQYSVEDFYEFEKAAVALNDTIDDENLNSKSFNGANNSEYSTFYLKRLITVGKLDSTYGANKVVDGYKDISFLCFASEEQTEYAYSKLSQNDDILVIVDQIISANDYSDNEYDYSNHLNWGYGAINAGGINDYLSSFGTDEEVVVAVLDTGINTSHEMLQDRILSNRGRLVGYSYYQTTNTYSGYSFEDDQGHGSHVSGIITSSTPDNVKILPIKVLNSSGSGTFSQVLLAFERIQAVYSSYNICCINLSLGGVSDTSTLSQLDSWFETLREQDILSVVSAGNDKLDTANYMPANSDNVITVSALKRDGDSYSFDESYSNFGQSVDIAAPGSSIISAYFYYNSQSNRYASMSGTSMAAPHVSAAVALLCCDLQYWNGSSHTYTADEIEARLYQNTTDLGEPGKDIFYGYGMLDLKYFNVQNNQDVLSFKDGSGNVVSTETYTEFTSRLTLNVSSSDSGYRIFYTTDGTTPDKNSYEYLSPLNVTNSVIYKFIALKIVNGSTVASSIVYTVELFNPNDDVSNFFVIDSNNVVIEYTGHFKNLVIPDVIDGRSVEELGDYLFYDNIIETVVIPDSCQIINSYCFSNCENLTEVTFENVYFIGGYAFENCTSLSSINLDSVTQIAPRYINYDMNGHIFDGCTALTEVYLPNIELMGANNFANSQVKSVYIGLTLTTVYGRAIDSGITVYGYKDSSAEEYCDDYGNIFVALDELEIISDLPSTKSVTQYTNERLSITAAGFILSYQWYQTEDTITNGVAIAGETSSSMRIDTSNIGEKKYFVYISAWGGKSIYSSICTVTTSMLVQNNVAQIYDGTSWQYYQSLNDAVDASSDGTVIVLTADCYLTEPLVISYDISIIATNNASIFMTSALENVSLITISKTLTLGSTEATYQGLVITSLVIDGQSDSFDTLFLLEDGALLKMQSNARIQNFTLESLIQESGNATFNMLGGTITNINKTGSGGLIDLANTTLSGGTISNCTATSGNLFDVTNGKLTINTSSIINNSFIYLIASYYDGDITITGGGFGNNECRAIILYNVIDNANYDSFTNTLNLNGGVSLNNRAIDESFYDVIISDRESGDILNCVNISSGCQFTNYYIDNSRSSFSVNINDSLYSSLVLYVDFYNYEAYLDESHPIFTLSSSAVIDTDNLQGEGYSFILNESGNAIYLKDTTIYHIYYVVSDGNILTQFYYRGDKVNIIAAPTMAGYNFLGWYQDQDLTAPFTLDIMPASDVYVYAKWEIQTFIITANCSENGSISPSGEIVVEYGQDKLFTFSASDDYHVSLIQVDGAALSDEKLSAAIESGYLFENITAPHSIYVEFEINSYSVSVSVNEYGSVSPDGNLTFTHGQDATFTLSAGQGAYLQAITINGNSVDSENLDKIIENGYFTLNITENYEIYVEFTLHTFIISASTNGYGTLSPSGDINLPYGSSQLFAATANKGYHLTKVEIDGVELGKSDLDKFSTDGYTFNNITQNHSIYVEYEINSYTISASSDKNGKISPAGTATYKYGDNIKYQISANTGYKIKSVFVDNVALISNLQDDLKNYNYTFQGISINHEIYAEFEIIVFDISINVEGNGTVTSLQDRTSAEYGENRQFTVNTDFENYDVEVYVNDVLVDTNNNQFSVNNIDEDIEIDVRFLRKPFANTPVGKVVIVAICILSIIIIVSIPISITVKRKRMYKNIDRD